MKEINNLWIALDKDLSTLNPKVNAGLLKRSLLSRFGLFLGYDIRDRKKTIILSLKDKAFISEDDFPQWEGVVIEKRIISAGIEGIVLKLVNDDGIDIYNSLAKDIYSSLSEAESDYDAISYFINTLYKWNEFFKKFGVHVLSEIKQRGLYGELFFLYSYVLKIIPPREALKSWCGNRPYHQDFNFINGNVEVKATIGKEHKTVLISSEKQLDNTGLKHLFLYCISLNKDINSGESLPDLVKKIQNKINSEIDVKYLFKDFLLGRGYLEEHEKFYNQNKYILKKEYFFEVKDNFPRIVDLPEGVGDLKYSINVSSCRDYITKTSNILERLTK